MGIRWQDTLKSNNCTELCIVNVADRWRERNVWYSGRSRQRWKQRYEAVVTTNGEESILFHQDTDDAFLFFWRRSRCIPDLRDFLCKVQDVLFLFFGRDSGFSGTVYGIVLFCSFQFFELQVPVGFQGADNQPVFRVCEHELPLCAVSFILCTFDREEPLLIGHPVRIIYAVHDFQRELQF